MNAEYEVEWEGQVAAVQVADGGGGRLLRLTRDGRAVDMALTPVAPGHYLVQVEGMSFTAALKEGGDALLIDVGAQRWRVRVRRRLPIPARGQGRAVQEAVRPVTAPMPGLLVSVEVGEGEPVRAGQVVAIMEAMKMRMEIRAPVAGTVTRVHVRGGAEVAGGQAIVTLG